MKIKATVTSEPNGTKAGRRILMTATAPGWRPVITDHKNGFTIDYDPPPEFDHLTELRFEVARI